LLHLSSEKAVDIQDETLKHFHSHFGVRVRLDRTRRQWSTRCVSLMRHTSLLQTARKEIAFSSTKEA
jgi:hypothetical protein